jgi:flagellar motility protein MotE (MotC chaperone)
MQKLPGYVRLLPLIMAAASLLLLVKLGSAWQGAKVLWSGSMPVATAHAENAPAAQAPRRAPLSEPKSGAKAKTAEAPATDTVPPPQTAAASPPALPPAALPASAAQPAACSPAELNVLQQLAARRESLDARARTIEQQADLLKAAETRIDGKIKELQALKTSLDGLMRKEDEEQEKRLQSLVKVYENMKAPEAARILEELDMATLLPVLERMKERKLAPIMAEMAPAKAKDVTVELAKRRAYVPAKAEPEADRG